MKYLITGGSGFIGSHITEQILINGDEAIIIDNLRTGNLNNLKNLNVEFINGDIRDHELVNRLINRVDGVFHLAALVSVPESFTNTKECIEINNIGLVNILNAIKDKPECKIIFSSSSACYGNNPVLPKNENMKPEPISPYAVTKLDGEFYIEQYKEAYSIQGTSLRYFNVYGPRQNPKSQYAAAIPIFINQALRGQDITIHGDGNQTRDFIFVKDVAKANLLAFAKGHNLYNVATGESITIVELAHKIKSLTNSKSEIKHLGIRTGDVKDSYADINKIKSIGFIPSYSFDEGLKQTIDYYEMMLTQRKNLESSLTNEIR